MCLARGVAHEAGCAPTGTPASSAHVIKHSEAQFVDRGWQKTLLRLGIVPALDGNASAMPPDAGVSKQVDRVSGIVTHTP